MKAKDEYTHGKNTATIIDANYYAVGEVKKVQFTLNGNTKVVHIRLVSEFEARYTLSKEYVAPVAKSLIPKVKDAEPVKCREAIAPSIHRIS